MRDKNGRYIKGHLKTSGAFKKGHGPSNTGRTRFKKGHIPPFKGKPLPDEVKKKLSLALKGRRPPKTAFKKGDVRLIGKNNKNWKGGVTPENMKLRNSPQCREWRRAVFIRDGFSCQTCNKVGGQLEAHHIKSWSGFPDLRFDINNGVTLCSECHALTDNYKNKRKYIIQ